MVHSQDTQWSTTDSNRTYSWTPHLLYPYDRGRTHILY